MEYLGQDISNFDADDILQDIDLNGKAHFSLQNKDLNGEVQFFPDLSIYII